MEKLYSGMTFLYRTGGYRGTVLDIRLKNNVRGDILQRALLEANKRFEYFTAKLVEKNGDFYTEKDLISMTVNNTTKFRTLGSMSTGYHLIDVTYHDNCIYVSWHHAIADGKGIKPYVESLLYYYFKMKDNKKYDSTGIRLAGEPLLEGETKEPFCEKFEVDPNKQLPNVIKDGFAIEENKETCTKNYRYEFLFEKNSFIRSAKNVGGTPATYISLLISKAISKVYPNFDKPIISSVAFDNRKALGLENTHKNCVSSIFLPYSHDVEKLPFNEQNKLYRNIMTEQTDDNYIKVLNNGYIDAFSRIGQIDSLDTRIEKLGFISNTISNTFVLSYLGQFQLNDYEEHISSIHLYNSGIKGLRFNMISAGDHIALDMIQMFESESILNSIKEVLRNEGLTFSTSERIEFETAEDKTQKTAGHQAEKYKIK